MNMEELFSNAAVDLNKAYHEGVQERLYTRMRDASRAGRTYLSVNKTALTADVVTTLAQQGIVCTSLPDKLVIDWSAAINKES